MQDVLSWWKTDELGAFLIGRGKRTKHILGLFQQMREEQDPGWILERLQPLANVTEDCPVRDEWRILDLLYVFLRQHMCNHNIEKCAPVPGTQLDKLNMIWRAI